MQISSWAPEHSEALREQIVRGRSYGEAVEAVNAQFGAAYTRAAAIGRGTRMGLVTPARPKNPSMLVPRGPKRVRKLPKALKRAVRAATTLKRHSEEANPPAPPTQAPEPAKLRCVAISPRLLSPIELEAGDCRYPYGGDKEGEPISFCGHPCFRASSYCAPHFHLTRAPAIEAERPAGPFVLRLVQAA